VTKNFQTGGLGRSKEGLPTAAPSTNHRERILKAAMVLLPKGGRDALTTRAVAEAAGVQPPILYRLFSDKAGLLTAVAEYGFGGRKIGLPNEHTACSKITYSAWLSPCSVQI